MFNKLFRYFWYFFILLGTSVEFALSASSGYSDVEQGKESSCAVRNVNWFFDTRPTHNNRSAIDVQDCCCPCCPDSPCCCCGIPERVSRCENGCLIAYSFLCFPFNALWRGITFPWQDSMFCCDVTEARCDAHVHLYEEEIRKSKFNIIIQESFSSNYRRLHPITLPSYIPPRDYPEERVRCTSPRTADRYHAGYSNIGRDIIVKNGWYVRTAP